MSAKQISRISTAETTLPQSFKDFATAKAKLGAGARERMLRGIEGGLHPESDT